MKHVHRKGEKIPPTPGFELHAGDYPMFMIP